MTSNNRHSTVIMKTYWEQHDRATSSDPSTLNVNPPQKLHFLRKHKKLNTEESDYSTTAPS